MSSIDTIPAIATVSDHKSCSGWHQSQSTVCCVVPKQAPTNFICGVTLRGPPSKKKHLPSQLASVMSPLTIESLNSWMLDKHVPMKLSKMRIASHASPPNWSRNATRNNTLATSGKSSKSETNHVQPPEKNTRSSIMTPVTYRNHGWGTSTPSYLKA